MFINLGSAGPECSKIMRKLEMLEPRVPPEHAPYMVALKAIRGLNQMANLVGASLHHCSTVFLYLAISNYCITLVVTHYSVVLHLA